MLLCLHVNLLVVLIPIVHQTEANPGSGHWGFTVLLIKFYCWSWSSWSRWKGHKRKRVIAGWTLRKILPQGLQKLPFLSLRSGKPWGAQEVLEAECMSRDPPGSFNYRSFEISLQCFLPRAQAILFSYRGHLGIPWFCTPQITVIASGPGPATKPTRTYQMPWVISKQRHTEQIWRFLKYVHHNFLKARIILWCRIKMPNLFLKPQIRELFI